VAQALHEEQCIQAAGQSQSCHNKNELCLSLKFTCLHVYNNEPLPKMEALGVNEGCFCDLKDTFEAAIRMNEWMDEEHIESCT
jgi:hypothetical protein